MPNFLVPFGASVRVGDNSLMWIALLADHPLNGTLATSTPVLQAQKPVGGVFASGSLFFTRAESGLREFFPNGNRRGERLRCPNEAEVPRFQDLQAASFPHAQCGPFHVRIPGSCNTAGKQVWPTLRLSLRLTGIKTPISGDIDFQNAIGGQIACRAGTTSCKHFLSTCPTNAVRRGKAAFKSGDAMRPESDIRVGSKAGAMRQIQGGFTRFAPKMCAVSRVAFARNR